MIVFIYIITLLIKFDWWYVVFNEWDYIASLSAILLLIIANTIMWWFWLATNVF